MAFRPYIASTEGEGKAMTQYVATINVPGYLPMDDEPAVFDTAQEAWRYLADERMRGEDDTAGESYSETVDALDFYATSEDETTGTVYGDTPGYEGDHDFGLAYSVSVYEGEE